MNRFCKLSFALPLAIGYMAMSASADVLLSADFEGSLENWDLRNARVISEISNRFVRLKSAPGEKCWGHSPMRFDVPSGATYTIRLRARGKGILWLNVIDLMRDGNHPPTDPVMSVRPRFQTLRVNSADWQTIGARSVLVRPHAETVRVSVELRGHGEVDIDDLRFEPDPPLRECPGFRCQLESDTIVLGEEIVARITDDEPLSPRGRHRFAFVSPWQSETHETDESFDGTIFRARPVRAGKHILRAIREDAFGAEAVREQQLTVLPAPPPPKAEPTLNATLKLTAGTAGTWMWNKAQAYLQPRLGFREYVRLIVKNAGETTRAVILRPAKANPSCEATFISPIFIEVAPSATVNTVLPIQTFLNFSTSITLVAEDGSGRQSQTVIRLNPEERYPIFGTQDQLDRTPPGIFAARHDIARLRELPCQVFRIPDVMMWQKQTVQADGTFKCDFADADLVIDALWNEGRTQLHPFLGYVPNDVKPLDVGFRPAKSARYRAYVEAFVDRYKGKVRYWEAFNEPPWGAFKDYPKNGGEVLVELQRHLWETVKAKDPSAKCVAPGWCRLSDMAIIEDYIAKGGDKYVDVYDMHEYTLNDLDWRGRSDEEAAAEYLSAAFDEEIENGLVLTTLRLLRRHGIEKPLFVTECGGDIAPTTEFKRRVKGILFARTLLIWLSEGVAGVEQYEFGDYAHEALPSQFSLIRAGIGEKLPIFSAYREIILALTGATSQGRVQKQGVIRTAKFERGDECITAFWNVGANSATATWGKTAGEHAKLIRLDPRAEKFVDCSRSADGTLSIAPGSIAVIITEKRN